MIYKLKINGKKPVFTFKKNNEPIAIEHVSDDVLNVVEKKLRREIKNIDQNIEIDITKEPFGYSDFVAKPQPKKIIESTDSNQE